jgi:hypothetical protein
MKNRAQVILIVGIVLVFAGAAASASAQNYCAATASPSLVPSVGQWQRWEQTLTSSQDYVGADKRGNPYRDLQIQATFTNCGNGATFQTHGFWYGVQNTAPGHWNDAPKLFRIRGAFPAGTWQWQTSCSGKTTAVTQPHRRHLYPTASMTLGSIRQDDFKSHRAAAMPSSVMGFSTYRATDIF